MPSITNQTLTTSSLLEFNLKEFTENFEAEQSSKSRIHLLEGLLLKKFLARQPQPNIIDSAIQLIKENYGCCTIKALTENLELVRVI